MKLLIVSDTHGQDRNLIRAVNREKPLDKVIHLGDLGKDLPEYIETITDCPCFMVSGNNDWYSPLPSENVIMVGRHRAYICHGHYYNVSFGTKELERHARALDCDIAMYGHTHYPELREEGQMTILNPGSLTYPRQPGKLASYIVATVDDEGDPTFEVKYLEDL